MHVAALVRPSISEHRSPGAGTVSRGTRSALLAVVLVAAVSAASAQACVIVPEPPGDSHPSWSRDGNRIAFERTPVRGRNRIYTVEVTGRKERFVAEGSAPAWSPLGPIAFLRSFPLPPLPPRPTECPPGVAGPCFTMTDCDAYVSQNEIFAAIRPNSATNLTSTAENEFDVAWSPDGRSIAFVTASADPLAWVPRIAVASRTGSGRTAITAGPDYSPSWAPDGRRIAFVRLAADRTSSDIFVTNADGTGVTNLTNTPSVDEWSPDWSPDGHRIAFFTARGAARHVSVMDADGSRTRTIAQGDEPAWSPGARRIAFTGSLRGGATAIFVMRANGAAKRRVSRPPPARR